MNRARIGFILVALVLAIVAVPVLAKQHVFDVKIRGRVVGHLVLCRDVSGAFFATIVRADGLPVCGPSRLRPAGARSFEFDCNRFVFHFGCGTSGCVWAAGGRSGMLCRIR